MEFIDLAAQQSQIRAKIDSRISAVLNHGKYIMGPEVLDLEIALAEFCGAKHCLSCANGTDALQLVLMALGVGPGDAVIVPSFTFAASAEAPCLVGALPIFCEIDPNTFTMDPISLTRCITTARKRGLTPKAVIAVDLFGLPADYLVIENICHSEQLKLISDSAQGWGGAIGDQMTGTFGDATTTSFFPAKPLGCYGDGGAIFVDDPELAQMIESLRVHGKGVEKYDNVRIGMNSRLDTLQAAILLEKLAIYTVELEARNRVAERYTTRLSNRFKTPHVPDGYSSIWAQYTILAENTSERDLMMARLNRAGIPSVIYYPRPLHTQSAYSKFITDPSGLSVSEDIAKRVFSLPMHPYLEEKEQNQICEVLLS